jgi:hypothetical protein
MIFHNASKLPFVVFGGSLLSMQEAKQKHESNKMQMRDVIFEIMVAMK